MGGGGGWVGEEVLCVKIYNYLSVKEENMLLTGGLKSLLPHVLRRIIRCNRLSNTSGMAEGK